MTVSIELHVSCKQRLEEVISGALQHVVVQGNKFLDYDSVESLEGIDSVLPQSDKVLAPLRAWISEYPMYHFTSEYLARRLFRGRKYDDSSGAQPLGALDEYTDTQAVASGIVGQFCSLPWRYQVSVGLPSALSEILRIDSSATILTPDLRLVVADETFAGDFPLQSGETTEVIVKGDHITLANLVGGPPKWSPGRVYLQIGLSGFVGQFGVTETLQDALDTVKALLGLLLALRMLTVKGSRSNSDDVSMYVHRRIESRWEIERNFQFDPRLAGAFNSLVPNLFDGALGKEHWSKLASVTLRKAAATLSGDPSCAKLRLAAQWLFESQCEANDLLSFLNAAVVLEVLLGDKSVSDVLGVTELLANRCAYLIGGTPSERQEVLNDFRSIYDVRSRIVHRGKTRLNLEDRRLLQKLLWICHRVIQKEIDLVVAQTKERNI